MNISSKLYQKREWAYNMAVAHYDFGSRSRGATKEDFLKRSVKLFKTTIQLEDLYWPAYENLIYVYRQLGEVKKAQKTNKVMLKIKSKLLNKFDYGDQKKLGFENPDFYRIKLGSFGEFDTPLEVFEQEFLITVPLSEKITGYFAGKFDDKKTAKEFQEKMQKTGFKTAEIVEFKKQNAEILDF